MTSSADFGDERTRLYIPHYDLTIAELPVSDASWSDIVGFAASWDGYAVCPEPAALQNFMAQQRSAFAEGGSLPDGLTMLRTALFAEQRDDYHAGEDGDGPDVDYVHALVERIRALVSQGAHTAPPSSTAGGVRDAVMNAYDRLLAGYAVWGGWRYYGWGGYEDLSTYLGPAIWSERDCDLKLAYELEKGFPGMVHMEFPIAKWTRGDFAPPEVVQRVDVSVTDLSDFVASDDASAAFKQQHHEAFFEVKWCTKGWSTNSRELKSRRESIPEDVRKLANHIKLGRCTVAAMVVFDDEGWFEHEQLELADGWPAGVWRLDLGPRALRWRGLITHAQYEQAVERHAV